MQIVNNTNSYYKNFSGRYYTRPIDFYKKIEPEILNAMKNEGADKSLILELIKKDILENRIYNYIDNEIEIDFELSITMEDLVNKAEEADLLDDYGLYMNLADAIDSQGKKEVTNHIITENEWRRLARRYCL